MMPRIWGRTVSPEACCKPDYPLALKELSFQAGTWAQQHHARVQEVGLEYKAGSLVPRKEVRGQLLKVGYGVRV